MKKKDKSCVQTNPFYKFPNCYFQVTSINIEYGTRSEIMNFKFILNEERFIFAYIRIGTKQMFKAQKIQV